MKNSVTLPTTTSTSKSTKTSFVERLAQGEDIEQIITEDETPTTAEKVSQPIETPKDNETVIETPFQRAERGTVKKATLELFESLEKSGDFLQEDGTLNRSEWCQMAVNKGLCKNVRQAANILRYDFLKIERVSLDGTTTKTKMSALEAVEHYKTTKKDAKIELFNQIANAKKAYFEKVNKAYGCLKVARKNESEIAAESVKKAGDVLKTLEKIDTSKVEITPEMREMMMKMLGLTPA